MNDPIGESIGRRYRVLELLGSGIHGTVYKVLDTRLQRLVALKFLRFALNAEAKQVFLREAVTLVRLKHPNIVQVYDADQSETFVYQVFEYIEGRTLGQLMADAKRLDPTYAIEIVRQVGTGLGYAHLHGVIHRDVKPSNILISNDGRVLLADFGLAIAPGAATLTQTGTIQGTPAYMSPEQVMGQPVDVRSDIFSLGVVFYELLTGRKPFSGESTAKLFSKVVKEEPASPRQIDPSVPSSINEIVLKSLAKEPGQRFQTIDDFLRALAESNTRLCQQEAVETVSLELGERTQWGDMSQGSGPQHTQRSDSRVTGRTDQALPSSLEQAVRQRDLRSRELTETELTPYSPLSSSPAEAPTHYPNAIAWLLVLDGQDRGREIRLKDNVTIGRDADNDIVLHDARVSRRQAQISLENGRFYISDWSQARTTYVNRIATEFGSNYELHDRDEIELGMPGSNLLLFEQAVSPVDLTPEAKRRLREFDEIWDQLTISAHHD